MRWMLHSHSGPGHWPCERVVLLLLILVSGLVACASGTPGLRAQPIAVETLLHDEAFATRPVQDGAEQLFAMSPAMQAFLREPEVQAQLRRQGTRDGLIQALYTRDLMGLQLQYDGSRTRSAAEAFADRRGNCLSLVLMTTAFARALALPVSWQLVSTEAISSRSGDLVMDSVHVNITLARRLGEARQLADAQQGLTVDFLPRSELIHQRARTVGEAELLAMVRNNRAAESLAAGDLDLAYAWARAALRGQAESSRAGRPVHLAAYTTLAVIYGRRGLAREAERLYRLVLDHEPGQRAALSNLAGLLRQQGREAEAAPLQARLQALEAEPPYEAYRRGRAAYARGDAAEARTQFLRELERHPEDHELHFWTALADLALGDTSNAGRELEAARRSSTRPEDQARYAAKLQRLSEALRAMP